MDYGRFNFKTAIKYCEWLESKGIEQETRIFICCEVLWMRCENCKYAEIRLNGGVNCLLKLEYEEILSKLGGL